MPEAPCRRLRSASTGTTSAVDCGDPDENVCLLHGDGSITRLGSAPLNYAAQWSPDSQRIAYSIHRQGAFFALGVKRIGAREPERELLEGNTGVQPLAWHPDNSHILVYRAGSDLTVVPSIVDLSTGREVPYLRRTRKLYDGRFSPDGRWFAYEAEQGGSRNVYISSYPDGTRTYRVSRDGGIAPRWRGDGRELYFLEPDDAIFAVDVLKANKVMEFGLPHLLFRLPVTAEPFDDRSFDVDRNGSRFVVIRGSESGRSEMVLVTNWK